MDKIKISHCADALIDIMYKKHYKDSTIYQYRKCFTDFLNYSKGRHKEYFEEVIAIEYANSVTGLELKDLVYNNKSTNKYIVLLRSLRILGEYSRTKTFTPKFAKFHDPIKENTYWDKIYHSFILYLDTDCDYKESTIKHKKYSISKMFNILLELNVNSLDEVNQSVIEVVVSSFIHETPKSLTHTLGDLKQFFQFCFDFSLDKNYIVSYFPNIKTPHESKIPISFTADEAQLLLSTIDKSDPKGKRDYAILMIASHLGLRAVDIRELKLSSFNWQCKTIRIAQEKTNHTITLPILNDVGWSIIDYIRNGRPDVDNEYLFLQHRAPYEKFANSSAITSIFVRRLHKAGIKIKKGDRCGIHSLRHTLGCALLEKETPLPVISQILGHQSIKSTEVYLKINMKGLNECPIDPERVFEDEL